MKKVRGVSHAEREHGLSPVARLLCAAPTPAVRPTRD